MQKSKCDADIGPMGLVFLTENEASRRETHFPDGKRTFPTGNAPSRRETHFPDGKRTRPDGKRTCIIRDLQLKPLELQVS